MSIVERIVTVYNDKGSKQAVKDLKKLEKDFVNAGKKIGKAFAVATVAVGAFAVKVGVDAVKGAIEDQKSQALLANSLRNTTGATDAAIRSVEEYISKQQMLVAVTDTELRQSLITLTTATGDLTQAQALQNVALDTAAGTTKDLQTVSLAIAKAFNGNIGALTKLGVTIDKNIVKNKDFKGAVEALTKAYGGAAVTAADTLEGRLKLLGIAYDEILETLGYALLPVIKEFAEYIVANVLPALEKWVNTNKEQLAEGLKDVGNTLVTVGKLLAGFFKVISNNLGAVQAFAAIFVGAKLATGIYGIVTAIGVLRSAFIKQTAAATAAGTATAFASGGASAIAAGIAIGTFVVAAGAAYVAINKLTDATDAGSKSTQAYNSHLNGLAKVAEQVAATNLKNKKVIVDTVKVTKDQTAAEKKAAEVRAAIKKAGLDVFGIKNVSDTDPVQLEAARLNLLKQNNLEELRKVELLLKSAEAQMKVNVNAQRYADILVALADNKISPDEIGILAAKWGMTVPAVTNYLAALLIVKDAKVDDSEVALLAAAWGISKDAAQQYLDFYAALNDGKLSDEEIAKLQTKWDLTYKEVLQYSDFVAKLDDFKLTDTEITNLQDQWGLTTDQVIAYTRKIGLPVSYSGTLIEPAKAAEAGWNKANAALTAYIVGLDTAKTQSAAANAAAVAAFEATAKAVAGAQAATAATAAATAASEEATAKAVAGAKAAAAAAADATAASEEATAKAVAGAQAAAAAAADATAASEEAAQAAAKATADAAANAAQVTADASVAAAAIAAEAAAMAEAIVAAAEAAAELARALAGLTADEIRKALTPDGVEGGVIEELPPGINSNGILTPFAKGGIVTSPTMALIGEAGPEAVIPLSGSGGFGGGITINISNAGSVIAEADLVSSIRNALLQAQNNGQVITKSSVSI